MTPPDFDDWLLDSRDELIEMEKGLLEESFHEGYDTRDDSSDPYLRQNTRDDSSDPYLRQNQFSLVYAAFTKDK
jgi:hypothetical protein